MGTVLPPWPDAELVVMALLDSVGTTVTATDGVTEPVIRINRTGGDDDRITDRPVIEVACFAPDRAATGDQQPAVPGRELAWAMAEQCRQVILAARRTVVTYTDKDGREITALIDNARTATPPDQLPYGNENVRTVVATYVLAMRRLRTA